MSDWKLSNSNKLDLPLYPRRRRLAKSVDKIVFNKSTSLSFGRLIISLQRPFATLSNQRERVLYALLQSEWTYSYQSNGILSAMKRVREPLMLSLTRPADASELFFAVFPFQLSVLSSTRRGTCFSLKFL
jgi:hypothetical protein